MTRLCRPRTVVVGSAQIGYEMNTVEHHAMTLVKENEDVAGFTSAMLVYALAKIHGPKASVKAVDRLVAQGHLLAVGERIITSEDDDNE